MVQPREKGFVLERLFDKRIDFLLERQVHTNTDGAVALRSMNRGSSLIGRLHQARTAAGNDVTAHLSQSSRNPLDLGIDMRPRLGPRRTEDRHPVALALR